MNTRLVLDTSAVLVYFRGSGSVSSLMNNAEVVFLPSVTVGELYFGARKCLRPYEEEAKIEALVERSEPLFIDYHTARVYGSVVHQLESKGQRIPLNDIWIGALALQHNCSLLGRDAHFDRIDGLDFISV